MRIVVHSKKFKVNSEREMQSQPNKGEWHTSRRLRIQHAAPLGDQQNK
jgi:hypothetical protein